MTTYKAWAQTEKYSDADLLKLITNKLSAASLYQFGQFRSDIWTKASLAKLTWISESKRDKTLNVGRHVCFDPMRFLEESNSELKPDILFISMPLSVDGLMHFLSHSQRIAHSGSVWMVSLSSRGSSMEDDKHILDFFTKLDTTLERFLPTLRLAVTSDTINPVGILWFQPRLGFDGTILYGNKDKTRRFPTKATTETIMGTILKARKLGKLLRERAIDNRQFIKDDGRA